jgi:hypothetical protein
MSEDAKQLIEQIAAESEATMNDPAPPGTVYTRPNRARSAMFSLRLNPEELAAVQALAEAQGVPASTLARAWIVQRLAAENTGPNDTATMLDRLETDVRVLRKLVAS